jgi:hypothetical protein
MKGNRNILLKQTRRDGTTKETGHRNMNDEFFKDSLIVYFQSNLSYMTVDLSTFNNINLNVFNSLVLG